MVCDLREYATDGLHIARALDLVPGQGNLGVGSIQVKDAQQHGGHGHRHDQHCELLPQLHTTERIHFLRSSCASLRQSDLKFLPLAVVAGGPAYGGGGRDVRYRFGCRLRSRSRVGATAATVGFRLRSIGLPRLRRGRRCCGGPRDSSARYPLGCADAEAGHQLVQIA